MEKGKTTEAKVEKFEDLRIFVLARELNKLIYAITDRPAFYNDKRFTQQIHAATGSIMDNIAEGYERNSNKEFITFLYYAKGSCGEVRSQIIRAYDVNYITKEEAKDIYNRLSHLSSAIYKFISKLKTSIINGDRYKSVDIDIFP